MASPHITPRDERGANLVEFVIVLPLLVLLVFGIIEFGVNFDRKIGVNSATRDTARAAIVGNVGATCETGSANITFGELECFAEDRLGLDDTDTLVRVIAPSSTVGSEVKICIEYPAESITQLFAPLLSGAKLRSSTTMRIEQDKGLTTGGDALGWCT